MITIITSQHYLDDRIIKTKQDEKDYNVLVSPVFSFDGEKYQVIIDGNHSFRAAILDGVKPELTVATVQDDDRLAILESGDVESYLETAWMEGDWIDAVTREKVWQ